MWTLPPLCLRRRRRHRRLSSCRPGLLRLLQVLEQTHRSRRSGTFLSIHHKFDLPQSGLQRERLTTAVSKVFLPSDLKKPYSCVYCVCHMFVERRHQPLSQDTLWHSSPRSQFPVHVLVIDSHFHRCHKALSHPPSTTRRGRATTSTNRPKSRKTSPRSGSGCSTRARCSGPSSSRRSWSDCRAAKDPVAHQMVQFPPVHHGA